MQQVENDEAQHNQSGDGHGPRGDLRLHAVLKDVGLRLGRAVFQRELDRHDDVQHEAEDQEKADHPKRPRHAVEKLSVGIDLRRAGEDLEIARHMSQHVADQDKGP